MNRLVYSVALLVFFTTAFGTEQPLLAQKPEVEDLRAKLERLQEKVKRLEGRVAQIEKMLHSSTDGNRRSQSGISPDGWESQENWRRLQKGMSKSEVRQILGKPGKVRTASYGDTWYYPDVLGGSVSFEDDRVDGWSEP